MRHPLMAGVLAVCAAATLPAGTSLSYPVHEFGFDFTRIEAIAGPGTLLESSDGGQLLTSQYEVWEFNPAANDFVFTIKGTQDLALGQVEVYALNGSRVVHGTNFLFMNGSFAAGLSLDGPQLAAYHANALAQPGVGPEPASMVLLGGGLLAVGLIGRRRLRR